MSPLVEVEANKKRPLTSRPEKQETSTNSKSFEPNRARFVSPIISNRARKIVPMSMASTPGTKVLKSSAKSKIGEEY